MDDTITILATGVGVVEGPVWHDDRLWFTRLDGDGHRGAVLRVGDDGVVGTAVLTGGGANGLAVAGDGTLYVANDGGREHALPSAIQRVVELADGTLGVETVADAVDGRPFRHCNDLCFGPDGRLWFTDSGEPYRDSKELVEAGEPPVHPGLVCRLDPATGEVEVVDASLYMPNGLAFSPDDEVLYVTDTVAHRVVVFPHHGGKLGPAERDIAIDGNPDGMCLDVDGRLYVATAIGNEVHVLSPEGELLRRIGWADGAIPLNCCFGGPDGTTLYVTDAGGMPNVARDPAANHDDERILAIALGVPGLPLHTGNTGTTGNTGSSAR
jgi:gluconolactonase